jgi:hypothetical protein
MAHDFHLFKLAIHLLSCHSLLKMVISDQMTNGSPLMSSTDPLFAQSALELIGQTEEHLLLRRCNLHINRCGGCGGPCYQQPCAICNYYPMGDDNKTYSPRVATFEHFERSIRSSAPADMNANLATWYFKTRFERVPTYKMYVPELVSQASEFEMPSARDIWDIVVVEDKSIRRKPQERHIQLGWSAAEGLNDLRRLREMDSRLSTRIATAVENWVAAAHSGDLEQITDSLEAIRLTLTNHTGHITGGNKFVALEAVGKAIESLPVAPAPGM